MAIRAEDRKFHYIYKITRTDGSGKYYIGMHSTDDLDDGYFGSGQLLWKSINKHGREKHSKEILEFFPSRKELKAHEHGLINAEMLKDSRCMNLKLGGEGGWDHITSAMQSANSIRGNAKMKILRETNPNWVASTKAAQSKGTKLAYREGRRITAPPNWTDRKHSIETRLKLSARAKERIGEKNSQFGTCWVCNPNGPKKIKQLELGEHLQQGYTRGRKYSPVL